MPYLSLAVVMDRTQNASYNDDDNSSTFPNCQLFDLIFYTVVIGTLCILGVTGNIVSIVVLRHDRNSPVAAFLLEALAVSDSLVLVVSFFCLAVLYGMSSHLGTGPATLTMFAYVRMYVTPLAYMTQNATILMTVLLAVNRYIAVCRPFSAAALCTLLNAKLQVTGVAVFCVAFNVPRFFQFRMEVAHTSDNATYLSARPTDIGEQSMFGKIYTNALCTIVMTLLPLLLLIGLNTRLMMTLRSARRRRDQFIHGRSAAKDEANISLVMVIIVVSFLVFQTPDRVLQIMKEFSRPEQFRCGKLLYFVNGVCTLLIILNSSTNFLIYYTWRRRFRKIFVLTFCRTPPPGCWRSRRNKAVHDLVLMPCTQQTASSSHFYKHSTSITSSDVTTKQAPMKVSRRV